MSVWINGRRCAQIDWRDRGLQYGDGLFETMSIRGREVRLLVFHLDRLYAGCRALGLSAPSRPRLQREIEQAALPYRHGNLKLILTRGPGARGYRPTGREQATRILAAQPAAAPGREPPPARVRVCALRLGVNVHLAGLKTLNRLESVLARSEWRDERIWEGLMLDTEENLISGTMSNLFVRRGSQIMTPQLDRCGVAGVMRRFVIESAPSLGWGVSMQVLRFEDLGSCDEVFMSNALVGLRSVRSIEAGRARLVFQQFEAARALRTRLGS